MTKLLIKMERILFFQGFRKYKFSISCFETVMSLTSEEMSNYNIFFIVLYECKDVFEFPNLEMVGYPQLLRLKM